MSPVLSRSVPALGALILAGCSAFTGWVAPVYDRVVINRRPDPVYEQLFPHYAELCAVSQYRRSDGTVGGIPGHAVVYIKGACLEPGAPYPRLEPCPGVAEHADDPHHGVGVSVNRWFKNVNWVGTPGKNLFFFGNLHPNDMLDEAHLDRTLETALELGMFRGVELHEYPTEAPERSLRDFVENESLGTDFALNFGRSVTCTRVPLQREQVDRMVAFLNELNRQYAEGEAEYDWSGFHDNCVHLVRNSLAAAGVWAPKRTSVGWFRQLFNLPVPTNEFVELSKRTAEFPLEQPDEVRADPVARQSLLEHGWLPARHGAVLETLHVHQKNEIFDRRVRFFALRAPITRGHYEYIQDLLDDARFVELGANLRFYEERYERILETGDPEAATGDPEWSQHYREYVERQLEDVRGKLRVVEAAGL